jgi:hypothetical protein
MARIFNQVTKGNQGDGSPGTKGPEEPSPLVFVDIVYNLEYILTTS